MTVFSAEFVHELLARVDALTKEVASLRAELADAKAALMASEARVAELEAENRELKAAARLSSRNSSLPPSKDGPGAPPRSQRRPSGRKPGGQVGHEGVTLAMVDEPDHVQEHRPSSCAACEHPLASDGTVVGVQRRQVFDLPEVTVRVTEHRLASVVCPGCQNVTKASGPQHASRQVQYGPGVAAIASYLVAYQHMPYQRAAHLLSDLLGTPMSTGTVVALHEGLAQHVAETFEPVAADLIAAAPVAHVDETGFKIGGALQWVHSISTPTTTWLARHARRGKDATDHIGILPRFTGVLVHDAWAPYDKHHTTAGHQLCCAHLLRELQAVTDNHNHQGGAWCWAEQVAHAIRTTITDRSQEPEARHLITAAIHTAERLDPDLGGRLGKKSAALRKRLTARIDDYLRFTTDPTIPATNNEAEQQIRMVKIKAKITGGMRTETGANHFLTLRSYLATARKHTIQPLDALRAAAHGNTWLPATP